MPDKLEINIKILTPLWTGGVEAGKCDRIHETGILGSLRWWMEVLVRGFGGNVCEPTEQKCSYDPKKPNNGLCDVCQIFGATGWKRRFRLEIRDYAEPAKDISAKVQLQSYQYQYKDKQGQTKTGTRTPTWYFPENLKDKPRAGAFTIQIQSLHPDFKLEVIGGLIQFIADWSALGARPQMGFGVIQIEDTRINTQPLYYWIIATAGSKTYLNLPSLQNIFLVQLTPKSSNPAFKEEDTFKLKYDLRNGFRVQAGKPDNLSQLRHFIMGAATDDKKDNKTEDKRMASKVKISRAYEGDKLMRLGGWVPEKADVYKNGWSREKVIDTIYQHLATNYVLNNWREMNSARDRVTENQTDVQAFLHSLLQSQEDN